MKSFKSKLCVNRVLTITLMSFLYMVLPAGLHAQNVAITDDDGYTVNSSAMLDVKSINKGLLIPRVVLVSTTDPVSGTKPEGLLVWNTSTSGSYPDPGFYYWSGSNWVKVGSSALDFGNGLTQTGNTVSHEDLSSQASVNNSNGTVIQDVTLGSLGHITGLGSYNLDNRYYTETEVDNLISGEALWDENSGKIYPATLSNDVGIGTNAPLHKLHVAENVNITDGTDGNFLDIQNLNNNYYVMSGIRFQNGSTANTFKGGIFYRDTLSWGRGDIIFANNPVGSSGNVTYGDARMVIRNEGKVEILGNPSADVEDPLLEVRNKDGELVFGVYNEGVRIYVSDAPGKGLKGGFAVGGYGASKGLTNEYLRVTPDSVRIYVDNEPGSKGLKGGFAVGGFSAGKGYENAINFMDLTPENYFIGHESGTKTTPAASGSDGKYNSFFGYQSGMGNTVGSHNLFMGYQSGYSNIYGTNNVFLGIKAGYENTGTVDSDYFGCYNVFIGYLSGMKNTEGQSNVFIGNQTGQNNTLGRYNTFIGRNTAGQNTEGNFNTYIGAQAAEYKTGGNNNVFLGNKAGASNGSGSGNVFLGYMSGKDESGSNLLYIDNSNTTRPLIHGDFSLNHIVIDGNEDDNTAGRNFYVDGTAGGDYNWYADSDERLKRNIVTIPDALVKIQQLRGVNFEWKDTESLEKGLKMGFIAQEAVEIIPEVVDKSGEYYTMQYAPITALLVEAVKEQQKMIGELKQENTKLKSELQKINDLQKQIDRLKNSLDLNK